MKALITKWGRNIASAENPEPLPEYPRPMLVREHWQNLNGYWKYAFTGEKQIPEQMQGEILVPFAPEASLSGVGRQLKPEEYLWYEREVVLTEALRKKLEMGGELLLHFGAVDQQCRVFVNDVEVGSHMGGYLPFTFAITEALKQEPFQIRVCVQDASDTSYHSVGKQRLAPGGMYYTATSGIWGTVWLEWVPDCWLECIDFSCDFEGKQWQCR